MGNCWRRPVPNPGTDTDSVPSIKPQPSLVPARASLKFLLLGAGESGKSTLFKQMRINYVEEYNPTELALERDKILKGFIASFGDLVKAIRSLSENKTLGSPELDELAVTVGFFETPDAENKTIRIPEKMSKELHRFMKNVWESDTAQAVWLDHSSYQITDSLSYFCEHLDRVSSKDFKPTEEDYLRCRVITVGILEQTFVHRGVTMVVVDVGGQRSERRKWVQAFSGVDAVFYVAAISEFNQQLFEDLSIARYDEALSLFKKTINIMFFREKPFVLFLNKEDLFDEKLQDLMDQNKNLDDYFPTLSLGHNYEDAGRIIKQHVQSLFVNLDPTNRVFPQFVTATDKKLFELVFQSATNLVLRKALNMHFDSKRVD